MKNTENYIKAFEKVVNDYLDLKYTYEPKNNPVEEVEINFDVWTEESKVIDRIFKSAYLRDVDRIKLTHVDFLVDLNDPLNIYLAGKVKLSLWYNEMESALAVPFKYEPKFKRKHQNRRNAFLSGKGINGRVK